MRNSFGLAAGAAAAATPSNWTGQLRFEKKQASQLRVTAGTAQKI